MDNETLFNIVFYSQLVISLVVPVALLIIGIIIAFNRVKTTRVIGISIIFQAINVLLNSIFYNILVHNMSGKELVGILTPFNLIIVLSSLLSTLFICIFIHRNYGRKTIYLPVFLIATLGYLTDRIVVVVLNNYLGADNVLWVNLISIIDDFIISASISVVMTIIFFRNKHKEKVIPKTWLLKTFLLVWGLVFTVFLSIIYKDVIANNQTIVATDMNYMLLQIDDSISLLIFPIYVLAGILKFARQERN